MSAKRSVVALLYDFDKTLCTKDMQEYTFIPEVGLEPREFWEESNELAKREKMDAILAYMYQMLKKANSADKPIQRENFVEHGKALEFFEGVTAWFPRINRIGEELNLRVEHYIISSGLKEIIEGSEIAEHFKEIFACEFYYDVNGIARWPNNVVNYTTKTQFLFRINKGILDISNHDDLNKYTPDDERPIPFRNMIYIGDGLTDVPCMKLVKVNGGYSIAVHREGKRGEVSDLLKHERVDVLAVADYSENSELDIIVREMMGKISMVDSLKQRTQKQLKEIDGA